MNIVNVSGQAIRACFSFDYRGYEVSCSTIASPPEIMVFRNDDTICNDRDVDKTYRADSVHDAIRWIDERLYEANTSEET